MTIMFFLQATTLSANRHLLDQLSLIEELALSPLSTTTFKIVSSYYEDIMKELRGLGIYRVPPSRLRAAGERLCADANRLFGKASVSVELDAERQQLTDRNTHPTWSQWMAELIRHETTPEDCLQLHRYYLLGWEPWLFHWPLLANATFMIDSMMEQNDTEWDTLWINSIVSGVNYAANAAIPPIRLGLVS
jgi:hypothetical protein